MKWTTLRLTVGWFRVKIANSLSVRSNAYLPAISRMHFRHSLIVVYCIDVYASTL